MTNEMYQKIRTFVVESEFLRYKAGFFAEHPVLHADHPMLRDLEVKLLECDHLFARTPHRNAMQLALEVPKQPISNDAWRMLSDKLQKHLPKALQSDEYKERIVSTKNFHQWRSNATHVSFDNCHGIELLAIVIHEGEHSEQTAKENWSNKENKMIAVSRVFYDSPAHYHIGYKNNYTEMQARLAQARFYLEVYQHLQNDPLWNMQERESFLEACTSMRNYLLRDVSPKEYTAINERNIRLLTNSTKSYSPFIDVFPGETPAERNRAAAQFLKEEGIREYEAVYRELVHCVDALSRIITPLRVVLNHEETRALIDMQDKQRNIKLCAQAAGVPLIDVTQLNPFPQGYAYIGNDESKMQLAIQVAQDKFHNLALVKTAEGFCLVYDSEPCFRPYAMNAPKPEPELITIDEYFRNQSHLGTLDIDEHDDLEEP